MILFGVSVEVSISELFIAGVGPGLLIGVALMFFVWAYSKYMGWGKNAGDGRLSFGKATYQAGWALLMPLFFQLWNNASLRRHEEIKVSAFVGLQHAV